MGEEGEACSAPETVFFGVSGVNYAKADFGKIGDRIANTQVVND